MSTTDWYRNTDWNSQIERSFFEKLRRARDKAQYLRIQACILASSHPLVALRLLDEYFGLNDNFDRAQAHVDRATAFLALGELDSAIASFESALSREDEYPNMQTSAYLELPFLVATRRVKGMYQRCLDLLSMHQSRLMFPIDHFKWHSAKALILWARGDVSRAKESARQALDAAARKRSGFRYHPDVGLVNESYQSTEAELTQLCNA